VSLSQFFVLQALLSCVIFLGEIPAGYVTDRIGYRQSMILSQILIFAARTLLTAAFFLKSLPLFVIEVLVEGLGACFASGTDSAYIYQIYGKENYLAKTTRTANCGTFGFIISTLAYAGIYAWSGIPGLLAATCLSSAAGICAGLCLKKPINDAPSTAKTSETPRASLLMIRKLLGTPQAWLFTLGLAALSTCWVLINFFYAERLVACQLDETWLTAVILGYSAIQMLAEPLLQKLQGKNKNRILFASSLLAAALLVVFGYSGRVWVILPLMFLLPLALEIPQFLFSERENDFIDRMEAGEQRATALSVLNMGINLLEIAALFSSAVLAKLGIGTCFLMAGALLAVVAVLLFYCLECTKG
jgi:MFS family permease